MIYTWHIISCSSQEFYTPTVPRNLTFFQQIPYEVTRSPSDTGSTSSRSPHRRMRSKSFNLDSLNHPVEMVGKAGYGVQLSLFVQFDKKAGWIRLADSAVGEFEFSSEHALSSTGNAGLANSPSRRSRTSVEHNHTHHPSQVAPRWAPIARCELPMPNGSPMKFHLLTKATETEILPCPLPIGSAPCPPLFVVKWKNAPSHVQPRVSLVTGDPDSDPPYLQLVGMGEHGVEVQEIPIATIFSGISGKGKGKAPEPIRENADAGGDTGFLCAGGHWDSPEYILYQGLSRSDSTTSSLTFATSSTSTGEVAATMKKQEGMYGWCRKGLEDWRIFWLGGPLSQDFEDDDDDNAENNY